MNVLAMELSGSRIVLDRGMLGFMVTRKREPNWTQLQCLSYSCRYRTAGFNVLGEIVSQ